MENKSCENCGRDCETQLQSGNCEEGEMKRNLHELILCKVVRKFMTFKTRADYPNDTPRCGIL